MMPRSAPRRSHRLHGRVATVLAALLLTTFITYLVPIAAASIEKANPAHPRITDGLRTLDGHDLSAPSMFLSGLRDNSLVSSYESNDGEILNCTDAYVQFSLDGSSPALSPYRAPLTCEGMLPLPGMQQTYRGALPSDLLKAAGDNARVLFQIVILVLPDTLHVDDNHGDYYSYLVDTTAPRVSRWSPSAATTGTTLWTASRDTRTPLSFRIEDDPTQSALDNVTVKINGADATNRFACKVVSTHARECSFDYAKVPPDFQWAKGDHRLMVTAYDLTGNPIDAASSTLVLRIDTEAPVISAISGSAPKTVPPSGDGLQVTARGANLSVQARVHDPSLDPSTRHDVLAQLVSEDGLLVSAPGMLTLDNATGVWSADDLKVPLEWPAAPILFGVRVTASDRAGNTGSVESAKMLFRLDPEPPAIFLVDVPEIVGSHGLKVHALVSDEATGVDPSSVKIRFTTIGAAKTATDPVGGSTSAYREVRMTGSADGSYTGTVPATRDGATIGFYVVARDRAGGETQTPSHLVTVDALAPTLTEIEPRAFRASADQPFRVLASDAGSGLNAATVTLHYRIGGVFRDAPMARASDGTFQTTVDLDVPDGHWAAYYIDASDFAGNVGSIGHRSSPLSVRIDNTPPTVTITAPEETDGLPFAMTWRGIDSSSGVVSYKVEARLAGNGWFQVSSGADTSITLCPAGPALVEFRAVAIDGAGNEGLPSTEPLAATQVNGPGCSQRLLVESVSIGPRAVLDANTGDQALLTWNAVAIDQAVPDASLRIDVDFSPDAGSHYFEFLRGLPNDGKAAFRASSLDACGACRFKVRATSFTGAVSTGDSEIFSVYGGNSSLDRDLNGLPDVWELKYAQTLGMLQSGADDDGDGLPNADEAQAGTNPFLADSDGDGATDLFEMQKGSDPRLLSSLPADKELGDGRFQPIYWIIPPTFVVLLLVYMVGLARRW